MTVRWLCDVTFAFDPSSTLGAVGSHSAALRNQLQLFCQHQWSGELTGAHLVTPEPRSSGVTAAVHHLEIWCVAYFSCVRLFSSKIDSENDLLTVILTSYHQHYIF